MDAVTRKVFKAAVKEYNEKLAVLKQKGEESRAKLGKVHAKRDEALFKAQQDYENATREAKLAYEQAIAPHAVVRKFLEKSAYNTFQEEYSAWNKSSFDYYGEKKKLRDSLFPDELQALLNPDYD